MPSSWTAFVPALVLLPLAGCMGGDDGASAAPAWVDGDQAVASATFTPLQLDAEASDADASTPDRPTRQELVNESFEYSTGAGLPDFTFEVLEAWRFVTMRVDFYATAPCWGTVRENYSPTGLATGTYPTTGAIVTSPSGHARWIEFYSFAACNPNGPGMFLGRISPYFTGETGVWTVAMNGQGSGVRFDLAVDGSDEE